MPKTSVIRNIDKEELVAVVANAKTFSDILRKYDLPSIGGIVRSLRRILSEYSISFEHIRLGRDSNKGKTLPRRYLMSLESLLVVNSKAHRGCLKKRLIKDGLLLNHCYECGLQGLWNHKKIVMILDHINGIHDDYRIENLRLLCPNCNSQTDTFAGRNKRYKHSKDEVAGNLNTL